MRARPLRLALLCLSLPVVACSGGGSGYIAPVSDGGTGGDDGPVSGHADLAPMPPDFTSAPLDFSAGPPPDFAQGGGSPDFAHAPIDFAHPPIDFAHAPVDFAHAPVDLASPPVDFAHPPKDLALPPPDLLDTAPTLTFTAESSGTTFPLTSVWSSGTVPRFVAGQAATMLRRDAIGWKKLGVPTNQNLWGVGGSGPTDIYAVGDLGVAIRSTDGMTWKSLTTGTNQALRSVYVPGGGIAFAVGGNTLGFAFRTTDSGVTWKPIVLPGAQPGVLWGVWGSGPDDVFVVGDKGVIYHYNGAVWSLQTSGVGNVSLLGVNGNGAGTVMAVGYAGTLVRTVDGGAHWQKEMLDGFTELGGVAVAPGGGGLTVGSEGRAFASADGVTWKAQTTGTVRQLTSVWRLSDGHYAVVGDSGVAFDAH